MVRSRKERSAGLLLGLLILASVARGAEVREEDLEIGDAFTQIERLHALAGELRGPAPILKVARPRPARTATRAQLASPPAESSIFADEPAHPVETKPLAPAKSFNPRVLGARTYAAPTDSPWARPEPKKDGVVGDAKVKFGSRKDISLATIAQNNAAAADAIAKAASAEPDFVNPQLEETAAAPVEKSFEEKLEELSEREAPFSMQDYAEFRDFVKENEERLWQLPNRDSRFHENLKTLYKKFGEKDGRPKASEALRRILGVDPAESVKSGQSKKRLPPANRTH